MYEVLNEKHLFYKSYIEVNDWKHMNSNTNPYIHGRGNVITREGRIYRRVGTGGKGVNAYTEILGQQLP